MAYCNKCGKELGEGDSFCHACGASVVKPGQAAEPVPPAAGVQPPSPPVPPVTYGAALTSPPVPPAASVQAGGETPQEIAERKVKKKVELWTHLGSYVIVNGFLVIVWALTGAGYPWFIWVMVGWGIGLAFHIMEYVVTSYSDPRREDMIRREMDKLQRKQGAEEEEKPPEEAGE